MEPEDVVIDTEVDSIDITEFDVMTLNAKEKDFLKEIADQIVFHKEQIETNGAPVKRILSHIGNIVRPQLNCTKNQYAMAAYLYVPELVYTDLLNKKIQSKINAAYKACGNNFTRISELTKINSKLVSKYINLWKNNGDQLSPEHSHLFNLKYDDFLDNKITTNEYCKFVFGVDEAQQILFLHMKQHNMIGPSHYRSAKYEAHRREKEWNLTGSYLTKLLNQQNLRCKLSGLPIKSFYYNRYRYANSADIFSIDRIDSNKPYCQNNVQLVRTNINFAKHISSNNEFYEMCARVALTGAKERNIKTLEDLENSLTTQPDENQTIDMTAFENKEFQKMADTIAAKNEITLEFTGSF